MLDAPAPPPACEAAAPAARFDARRLREGRFTYALDVSGKRLGELVITVRRAPGGLWRLAMDSEALDQHWTAVTDRRFRPVSAELRFPRRGRPYRMVLSYAKGRVSSVESYGGPDAPAPERRTHGPLPTPLVDQRIDWAGVTSLLPGAAVAGFHVFDAATGASQVTVRRSPGPTMDGPLGAQATERLDYVICKPGRAAERYAVFATVAAPRTVLREELRGEEITTLVRIEP